MHVLGEAVLVGALGVAAGMAANTLSDGGLDLTRDYFPRVAPATVDGLPQVLGDPTAGNAEGGNAEDVDPSATETDAPDAIDPNVAARIRGQGLGVMTHAEALAIHSDPAYAFGAFVFVDARRVEDFETAHIPGAVHFDHYHSQRHIAEVLPVVTNPGTLRVVVYCIGGDCEDSEFAAMHLMQLGVPPDRLFVYVGGMESWEAAGLPTESVAAEPADG